MTAIRRRPLASSVARLLAGGILSLVPLAATQRPASAPAGSTTFDSPRAMALVREQVAFGPRPAGSAANARARAHIIATLKQYGYAPVEQSFETPTPVGRVRMTNVIATLPGQRAERFLLASHFDSKPVQEFRFVGANDGGSSTGALLELARVLKAKPPLPLTTEFVFFDGEEAWGEWVAPNHTYGSRHYVTAARQAGTLGTVRGLVLLDMIGDRALNVRRDTNSTRWMTDIVWATARRLGHGAHFLDDPFPVEDDHMPFLEAGVPSLDIIDLDYPAWHTAADTLEQVSARSLQVVGDVVLTALPDLHNRAVGPRR
jgi:glutaminyl-peptide cyclotransferase